MGSGNVIASQSIETINLNTGTVKVLLSDEGIGPSVHNGLVHSQKRVGGPKRGSWKRNARKGPLGNPSLGDNSGKRQCSFADDVFNGNHKLPRSETSSTTFDDKISAGRCSPTRRVQ